MRALVIIALFAGVAAADPPNPNAFGFDHIVHDRDLIVKGGEALPCDRCHVEVAGKLVGKPGHTACFAKCHGGTPPPPKPGAKPAVGERAKVCTSCHTDAALARPYSGKLAVAYPPYTIDRDFNISFGHKQHGGVASCTQCHAAKKPAPHQRCSGCHDGRAGHGPAMSKCISCHPQAVGKPQPPELAAVHDSVTATFSHQKHAARGGLGKECITCHFGVGATNDTELPRPTAKDCAASGCHDGKAVFGTVTTCVRCHERAPPPEDKFEVYRPTKRFLHTGVHGELVKTRTCNACHPIDARGNVAVGGHAACVECHVVQFGARKPEICGACHNATEPWRHLVADRAPPDRTEFGATLDHAKHTASCSTCHSLRTATEQLRMPRGHASCLGAGCHAAKTGPTPRIEACDGCHRLGIATERATARATAPWSVRVTFDHSTHQASSCTACHTQLEGASVLAMPTPKKATCLPCHDDGKSAFKLTGTTCARCHTGARS